MLLFSTSSAYYLPILISVSVEYQLPTPRSPMLRSPTASTSLMLPFLTPGMVLSADPEGGAAVDVAGGAACGAASVGCWAAGAVLAGGCWVVGGVLAGAVLAGADVAGGVCAGVDAAGADVVAGVDWAVGAG